MFSSRFSRAMPRHDIDGICSIPLVNQPTFIHTLTLIYIQVHSHTHTDTCLWNCAIILILRRLFQFYWWFLPDEEHKKEYAALMWVCMYLCGCLCVVVCSLRHKVCCKLSVDWNYLRILIFYVDVLVSEEEKMMEWQVEKDNYREYVVDSFFVCLYL